MASDPVDLVDIAEFTKQAKVFYEKLAETRPSDINTEDRQALIALKQELKGVTDGLNHLRI